MNKAANITAWAFTIAAVAAGIWMWKNSRNSSLPSLVNNMDMDFRGRTDLSRGYRNNNPLNVRYSAWNAWKGKVVPNTDGAYEQFENMAYGYRAALYLLRKYIRQGYDTVAKIISRWAPENENNTQAYIDHVCEFANLHRDQVIDQNDKETLTAMARAMSICENGITDETKAAGLPNMTIINAGWELL